MINAGYRRENVGIKINEDGTQISISGEKQVQEMVMLGWKMQKQEVELRRFIKAFRIPSGVDLDRIKAKFRNEESVLTISMPKSAKGIRGVGIVEVKEEEVIDKGRPATKITKIASNGQKLPERVERNEQQQHKEVSEKEIGVPQKGIIREEIQEEIEDPKIKRIPEINKVAEKIADMEGLETTKIVYEDLPKEAHVEATVREKIEEPKIENKEEHDQADAGKLEVPQKEEEDEEKKVKYQEPADVKSIEEIDQNVAEASEALEAEHQTEKATPKADMGKEPEKEKVEKMTKEAEQIQKQTTSENAIAPESNDSKTGTSPPSKQETQIQETKAADGIHEDLQNQEAKKTLQADHDVPEEAESSQPDHPADQKDKDEAKETDTSENLIQEAGNSEELHAEGSREIRANDSPENGRRKDVIEGEETRERKPASRRRKLCRPCAIACSALLVSLVVIAIHGIRSRKR